MITPLRFIPDPAKCDEIARRFGRNERLAQTDYATVRDFCDSIDHLPQITGLDGDLKNVQRPWAIKTMLANVPPPARILEIGGGQPIVSGILSELGYDATLVDPYDGFGNGPTEYEKYVARFPHVKIRREYFRPGMSGFSRESFNAIFSVSVLEHLPPDALGGCFDAIAEFLAAGGASIHCFDFILQGIGDAHDRANTQKILAEQSRVTGGVSANFEELISRLRDDVDAFFLSPQGHHHWRHGLPYDQFPFRKVASIQSVGFKTAALSFNR